MLIFSRLRAGAIALLCLIGLAIAAESFVPSTALPRWMPHPQVHLGLDLQGGSYLLLEVDMKTAVHERLEALRNEARTALRKAGLRYTGLAVRDRSLTVSALAPEDVAKLQQALHELTGGKTEGAAQPIYIASVEGARLTYTLSEPAMIELTTKAVQQSIAIVRRRIDETGVNEPVVARQGASRILVELPGVSDPGRIKRLLGSTAKMTFRLVAEGPSASDPETDLLPVTDRGGEATIAVRRKIEVDGANLTDASPGIDQRTHEWIVNFTLDSVGARRFGEVSTQHVGERFAIVLDNKVISAPVIREPITGGRGQISGNFTSAEATDLAVLLRAGALPAPLNVVEERSIGPSLGADAIKAGLSSVLAGLGLVVTFMILAYGRFGLYATVAVIANLALTIAGLSLLGAALTLPGIAGILLALGMAVDANILVNERTREEVKRGRGVIGALEHGFKRAYAAILDANVTTLIKMLILFVIGTGAVKGFAVTISLGIVISMFTALVLVRLLIATWLKRARPKELNIGTRFRLFPDGTAISFMRARTAGLVVSAMISLAALGLAYKPGLKLGVDFAGGTVIEARVEKPADFGLLRQQLSALGYGPVQVQQFGSAQDILLRFESPPAGQSQEQIERVRATLEQVSPGASVRRTEVVGAAIGSELFRDGILGLLIASVAMFGYIAFRFEWPFAVGAIATMFLDLTKTIGFLALTGFEFNLASVAAILTIMGFSINDKIVVYDRIRENLRLHKKMPLRDLIDRSINETLSRTVGTSIALLLAIAPLALFGGPALWEFAVTLLFGLMLATSSSIFIAAPILLTIGEARLRRRRAAPPVLAPS